MTCCDIKFHDITCLCNIIDPNNAHCCIHYDVINGHIGVENENHVVINVDINVDIF